MRDAPDALLRPKEAAVLTATSVGYLRNSDCPKVLLPSGDGGKKPLVRYRRSELLAWIELHSARATHRQRRVS